MLYGKMAQAQVKYNMSSDSEDIQLIASDENMCLGQQQYFSCFKNNQNDTVVNLRKGTRSVTISKDFVFQIYDLRETVSMCIAFVEGDGQKDR